MSQPTRVFFCPTCGVSAVTLRPGQSWWDYCRNEWPLTPPGHRVWVCGQRLRWRITLAELATMPALALVDPGLAALPASSRTPQAKP